MSTNFISILEKNLSSKERIQHSIRVADTAVALAKKYNFDEEKAYTAGILHDIAKDIALERALIIAREHNFPLSESEILNKKLLHAPIGALIAENDIGISNVEICEAIRWHTTGKANMSTLEKIIYIADMIEPERKYKELSELKELAFSDINKAMLLGVSISIKKLVDLNRNIDPNSIDCYNYLIKN